jgi:hypothetical protein
MNPELRMRVVGMAEKAFLRMVVDALAEHGLGRGKVTAADLAGYDYREWDPAQSIRDLYLLVKEDTSDPEAVAAFMRLDSEEVGVIIAAAGHSLAIRHKMKRKPADSVPANLPEQKGET